MSNQNDLAEVQKHNRALLHALQTDHPVMRAGRKVFFKGVYFQDHGGEILARVYLVGEPEPYAPEQISLARNHYQIEFAGTEKR